MTHMHGHDDWTDRLSDYIDGELPVDEERTLEGHLSTCSECRRTVAELKAVAARARSLSDAPPARDLWPGVAGRVGALPHGLSRVIRPTAAEGSGSRGAGGRRFSFTLPQLVAAALALMVLSGGMVWIARVGGDRTDFPGIAALAPDSDSGVAPATGGAVRARFTEAHYDRAIEDLKATLDAGRAKLDAETIQVLEQNLTAIDRAIEQCRTALASDPANGYLSDHLVAAKQRKLALLRRATALADSRDAGL